MNYTVEKIIKLALGKLGLSLNTEKKEYKKLQGCYEHFKAVLLADHSWNFATRNVKLSLTTETHPLGLVYQLPTDYLKLIRLYGEAEEKEFTRITEYNEGIRIREFHKIELKKLITNRKDACLEYVAEVPEDSMTPKFAETLATYLAFENCYEMVQDSTLRSQLGGQLQNLLSTAKSVDSQEDSQRFHTSTRNTPDDWTNLGY